MIKTFIVIVIIAILILFIGFFCWCALVISNKIDYDENDTIVEDKNHYDRRRI